MRYFGAILIAMLILVSCDQNKIGYVEYISLMDDYQEKIDIENKYKVKSEAMNKKRDSLAQAIQLEYQAVQTRVQSMSEKKAQEEIGLLQQKSQFLGQQLQQEEQQLKSAGQTEMDSLVSKVNKEIEEYGDANGFTYILGAGDGASVLYGNDSKDLTEQILKILNDKYKK
ncbi:MAG: OmpH family outer membrane protein [Bacteroidota bacterium]